MMSLSGCNFQLYTVAADMRMGFNGLSRLVRNMMLQDPEIAIIKMDTRLSCNI